MDRKNIYLDSPLKVGISFGNPDVMDKAKRFSGPDGVHIRNHTRIYNSKMGEIAVKILNVFGLMGVVYGFISNLSNFVSILIGCGSFIWLIFRALKERENWLYRKSERKRHELENMNNEDEYIRNRRFK